MKSFLSNLNDDWFYQDPGPIAKLFTVFVKGDSLVLVPFLVLCILCIVLFGKIGIILSLCFLLLRFLGEMVYWFLQQFGEKTYRPHDYGAKHLSNNSLYIVYQLMALVWASCSLTGLLMVLFT